MITIRPSGETSDLGRERSTRARRISNCKLSPNSSRRSIPKSSHSIYGVLSHAPSDLPLPINLRILPTQSPNLLPSEKAGVKHRRRNLIHRVAERMVNEVTEPDGRTTNLPNSPDRRKEAMVPFLRTYLDLSLDTYQLSSNGSGERQRTFMTSNGCVTIVATAPAAAAEKLCATARFTPELGGAKRSTRGIKNGDKCVERTEA